MSIRRFLGIDRPPAPPIDRQQRDRYEDLFETECVTKCFEFAKKATELQPSNVDWWRLRAVLLYRWSHSWTDSEPRLPPDWSERTWTTTEAHEAEAQQNGRVRD